MVELVRSGRFAAQLSRDFNVSSTRIAKWLTPSAPADGDRRLPGRDVLSEAERQELTQQLRRENRQLRQERDILARATALFAVKGKKSSSWLPTLNADQAALSVQAMCRVLQVSTSGYYGWIHRKPPRRTIDNAVLI